MASVALLLLRLSYHRIVYGMGHARPSDPVVLTSAEVVRAVSGSSGLLGSLFGVVLIALSRVEGAGFQSVSWVRLSTIFVGLTFLAYLTLQGPDLLGHALGKDRSWVSAPRDVLSQRRRRIQS